MIQWYLNKSFASFKRANQKSQMLQTVPEHQREEFLQFKFDELYNKQLSEINELRVEAKIMMFKQADVFTALDNYLLRAFISLQRINISQAVPERQHFVFS